jgi:hypothetical protein
VTAFALAYTPAVKDAQRYWALQQGPLRIWLFRLGPVLGVLGALLGYATGDVLLPTVLLVIDAVLVTMLVFLWQYRRRLYWRSNPHAQQPVTVAVTEEGVRAQQAGREASYAWSSWGSCLVAEDVLVLRSTASRLATAIALPRRGLLEPERWRELTTFVAARVPLDPRSPVKPWVYSPDGPVT